MATMIIGLLRICANASGTSSNLSSGPQEKGFGIPVIKYIGINNNPRVINPHRPAKYKNKTFYLGK